MDSSVRRYGRKTALEFFGARTSYRELGAAISRAAAGLKKLGVRAGDRVALVLPNCPQHIIAFHAALRLGAVVVEHNPLYTNRELRHQFEDHGATVAVVWDKAVEKVRQLPADVGLQTVVSVQLIPAMPLLQRMPLPARPGPHWPPAGTRPGKRRRRDTGRCCRGRSSWPLAS
jgi:long-chain acyl-CoA synthetase